MTEYTKEMLLGSPVENGEEDAANDVEQCTSQRVSTSAVLKKCEQWRDISKNLAYITIECERVLSESFRTTDPIRNKIGEALDRQITIARETMAKIVEQLVTETKPKESMQRAPI
ncbi:unnamed protein product [Nippostrongylus brasiliensis]|uniref:t-SNARE coiled-coil homology domain-containing protein n=1 Tax=Nippostrongylus brasiliensis TaxID=27835 RepID=A0A0N4XLG7_NIPBR|nr:unnamed protein product [Nippostrongylus brasiliensis]